MADKYNTVTETVTALQFTFDNLKPIYLWLGYADVTYSVKNRTLSGIVTGANDEKLSVRKNDYVVKDSSGNISVWTADDFDKKFTKVKSEEE